MKKTVFAMVCLALLPAACPAAREEDRMERNLKESNMPPQLSPSENHNRLMSMPPLAAWQYDHRPEPGSPEAQVLAMLQPRDWAR